MSNISEHHIEQIAGFLAGELTPAELLSLQQWIETSDRNRRYFEEMKAVWQVAGSVNTSHTFTPKKTWQKAAEKQSEESYTTYPKISMNVISPKTERIIRRTLQVAAAVAVIFFGGMLAGYYAAKPDIDLAEKLAMLSGSKYITVVPRGSKSTIMLPDGSKVVLNAASKITYTTDFGWESREISLVGEAYFDVKSNPEKPFTVHTSHLDIQAFGTAFNVKAYPEDRTIETTLEHGELKVNSRNDNSLDISLQPKQNVVYYKTDETAPKQEKTTKGTAPSSMAQTDVPVPVITNEVNTSLYTSWKDAEWLIESKSFSELAGLLERRYNVTIVFVSNELKNYSFSGIIRNETIEQVLNVVSITAPLKYTIDQGNVRLQIDQKRKKYFDALTQ